ncbi:hypothetical protein [Streptomyces sp. SID3343]|uniref:hypothetical protein n=1 Tax=Streptomyces sp. SID3343 TaxID=2690260 RepID=UPI00136BFCFF|nr:hypothetical protein [Streptomyces sp. SID3343]MYV97270.1 hypothetical protein [Streptomyces sp. SID3343]
MRPTPPGEFARDALSRRGQGAASARDLSPHTRDGGRARGRIEVFGHRPDSRASRTLGYTGTSNAAAAVLADVLDLDARTIRTAEWEYDPIARLHEAFCSDFLSTACDRWRLRHGAILRWARAWYLQHGVTDLPQALLKLPEVPVS